MRHFTDALFEDLLQGLEDLELYFLSPDNMNGKILSPRVPDNFLIKNGYEDGETPRVCFAKSIDGALMALSQNLKGKELFVHQPVDPDFNNIVEPSLEQVPDVELTTEVWYTDDIEVKTIGKILVEEDDGLPGHKYTYGDNEAELYGWKWKWLDTENLKESASFEELNINSPEELLDWMEEHITYELANDEYGAEDDPPTKTAEEVLATGTGHCAEQSYLEKKVLDELGYNTQLIFVKENNSEDDYGADGNAHLFLTYIDEDDKQCWFEHSMEHMRGIHKYDSEEDLLQDVAKNWWRYDENSDTLEIRFIPEPITGVDNWGLAQKCHEYPVEATFDISENVLEKDTLDESLEKISYKDISDLDHYKKSAKEILGGFGGLSDNSILDNNKEIHIDDKLVGYIGFNEYDDVDDYNKVLGFGNFMILERGKGYGTRVIKDLVDRYKNKFDLIYCFVDADNAGAINLYKKLGNVYDEDGPNDNGQYYVTFWDKNENEY